mmetsp:Transcript_22154/g.66501  ORF Transcript_22154/g.66501 Transcript_22154/m.66501 type:complete len:275 (-) Transcript_22154:2754-3578(-)
MTFSAARKFGSASCLGEGLTTTRPPDMPLPQPSFASPVTSIARPGASAKPSDWPDEPSSLMVTAPSGRPGLPQALDTCAESIVPSVRSRFVVVRSIVMGSKGSPAACFATRSAAAAMRSLSALVASSWFMWWSSRVHECTVPAVGLSSRAGCSSGARSSRVALSGRRWSRSFLGSISSTSPAAPTSSSIDVMPSDASVRRISSAMRKKKLMTCSGWPSNLARSSGSCVAMPTGHVFRWHLRIMMQPSAMRGPVEKAYSSAPSAAATSTSRGVLS